MEVILAGVNIDWETLKELDQGKSPAGGKLTPETISAAYARISRNPRSVNELRQLSRSEVEKARRSNQAIVFDMGHSSIAEHAVFNIDILGVSRLAVEHIEQFRLASYTEKSQRYIRLEDDYLTPREISAAGLNDLFTETIRAQNALYHDLYEAVRRRLLEKEGTSEIDAARLSVLEGSAKEDARYILCLATESQLGMTVNARTMELMLRRAAAHHLAEINEYGQQLYEITKSVAPSLIRYTEATVFDRDSGHALRSCAEEMVKRAGRDEKRSAADGSGDETAVLVEATVDGDEMIIASLLHGTTDRSLEACRALARSLSVPEKEKIIKAACGLMEAHDAPLREFETAHVTFEVVMSASCFAQMKRHRMATIISRDYDPALGVTLPGTIAEAGMEGPFREMIDRTNRAYERIRARVPGAAPYILTNAHRRRVLITANVRELYHMARLRDDGHAQWDIRERVHRMLLLAGKVMPLSLMFACGKDAFPALKDRHMGTQR